MTIYAVSILASIALVLWYQRYTKRHARRAYAAYHRWVRNGGQA